MNKIIDEILIIALDENLSYDEKRKRINNIFENNRLNGQEDVEDFNEEDSYDPLHRPNFRDYESD